MLEGAFARADAAKADHPELAEAVFQAAADLSECIDDLVARDVTERFASAVPFQTAFARVLGGHAHLTAALHGDDARQRLATFYITRLLPEVTGLIAQVRADAGQLMEITPDDLAVA